MSQYESDQYWADEPTNKVDVRKLWAGGIATALVAAGVGIAGVLAIRGLLGIPILSARGNTLINDTMFVVAVSAGVAALVATVLLNLLIVSTPRPKLFFNSIGVLVIVVLVLQMFIGDRGTLADKVATAALYTTIGLVIMGLLSGVARTAVKVVQPPPPAPPMQHRPPPNWSDDRTQMLPPEQGYQQYPGQDYYR